MVPEIREVVSLVLIQEPFDVAVLPRIDDISVFRYVLTDVIYTDPYIHGGKYVHRFIRHIGLVIILVTEDPPGEGIIFPDVQIEGPPVRCLQIFGSVLIFLKPVIETENAWLGPFDIIVFFITSVFTEMKKKSGSQQTRND